MGVISVVATCVAVILFYCAIVLAARKDSYKHGVKYLIIALIFMIISIVCKTADVKVWLLGIYSVASIFPCFLSLCVFSKEHRAFSLMGLTVFVALVIALCFSGMKWSSDSSRKYYDNHGNVHYSEEKRDEQNFINDMYGAAYDN